MPGGYCGRNYVVDDIIFKQRVANDDACDHNDAGSSGLWWSATEDGSRSAYCRYIRHYSDYLYECNNYKDDGFSVRCLRIDG